jgi:hypothetical protein
MCTRVGVVATGVQCFEGGACVGPCGINIQERAAPAQAAALTNAAAHQIRLIQYRMGFSFPGIPLC